MHSVSLSIFISVTPCPAAELVGDLRCFQQHLNILKLNAYNETLGIPRLWRTRYLYRLPASRPASPATNRPAPSRPSHRPLAVVHHGADCKVHLTLTKIRVARWWVFRENRGRASGSGERIGIDEPTEQSSAKAGEKRVRAKENIIQPNTSPTQSGERVSQGLNGVREAARKGVRNGSRLYSTM